MPVPEPPDAPPGSRRRLAKWLGVAAAGVLLGWLSVIAALGLQLRTAWIQNGPWLTNLALGSSTAAAHTRALAALTGLFALQRTEAIYFIADRDSEGRPLRTRNEYRVEGSPLPARWWSVTIYGFDLFLIPNPAGRHSLGREALAEGDRPWSFRISREPGGGHWLPSGGVDRRFLLVLRLYDPRDDIARRPSGARLPEIVRLDR